MKGVSEPYTVFHCFEYQIVIIYVKLAWKLGILYTCKGLQGSGWMVKQDYRRCAQDFSPQKKASVWAPDSQPSVGSLHQRWCREKTGWGKAAGPDSYTSTHRWPTVGTKLWPAIRMETQELSWNEGSCFLHFSSFNNTVILSLPTANSRPESCGTINLLLYHNSHMVITGWTKCNSYWGCTYPMLSAVLY